jgi:hypothetical protein
MQRTATDFRSRKGIDPNLSRQGVQNQLRMAGTATAILAQECLLVR